MDLKIRKADLSDINSIMAIEKESFSYDIREDKQTFIKRIEIFNDGFWLLTMDKKIIGYISSEIWRDNADFKLGHDIQNTHDKDGKQLYISSIALANEARGKKLGHILFDYLIDYIPQNYPSVNKGVLLVSDNWEKAKKIYTKKGFSETDRIKGFFLENGIKRDGIIMNKVFNI